MQKLFAALSLADQRAMLKTLRADYATNRANVLASKVQAKEAKAQARADKQAAAIAKAQARLQKLLDKQAAPVGAKAVKANKRPSKATVTKFGAEDNAIAAAIMAKKASA